MEHHLVKRILTNLSELCQSDKVALYSVDKGSVNEILGGINNQDFVFPTQPIAFKGVPLEEVLLIRKPQVYPCILIENIPFPIHKENYNDFNCICFPIMQDKQSPVVAIAVVAQSKKQAINAKAIETLNFMNPLIADSLITISENQILYKQATVDKLTELYTRHYFEIRLQEEMTRVRRHGGIFSIMLIDIDGFKKINAQYGYQEGDRVLQEVSKILVASIRREIDIPCRYAGEQFTLLLPHTDVDGAYILGERIRKRCEQNIFLTSKKEHVHITTSVGIANNIDVIRDVDMDAEPVNLGKDSLLSKEELLNRADIMLTAAKQAGRNQVMVWW
ncbi:GGDEF domain-containing protein [Candidatus Albibeggiatoa sp. nov. NOAA]|uniref:GGDEF domain-containing protein n=1 Tax=Candidatus Albibeggiatoa sp. nov. NOAA TaxID=3162724 RepID=UPI0032FDF05B|nr:GGDEF domain-containing protein [Thiotrichaceae bacterium]